MQMAVRSIFRKCSNSLLNLLFAILKFTFFHLTQTHCELKNENYLPTPRYNVRLCYIFNWEF